MISQDLLNFTSTGVSPKVISNVDFSTSFLIIHYSDPQSPTVIFTTALHFSTLSSSHQARLRFSAMVVSSTAVTVNPFLEEYLFKTVTDLAFVNFGDIRDRNWVFRLLVQFSDFKRRREFFGNCRLRHRVFNHFLRTCLNDGRCKVGGFQLINSSCLTSRLWVQKRVFAGVICSLLIGSGEVWQRSFFGQRRSNLGFS